MEQNGLNLSNGVCNVNIFRTMFDGKMSKILTVAGGASCQMCSVTYKEMKEIKLIRSGFPINRHI